MGRKSASKTTYPFGNGLQTEPGKVGRKKRGGKRAENHLRKPPDEEAFPGGGFPTVPRLSSPNTAPKRGYIERARERARQRDKEWWMAALTRRGGDRRLKVTERRKSPSGPATWPAAQESAPGDRFALPRWSGSEYAPRAARRIEFESRWTGDT